MIRIKRLKFIGLRNENHLELNEEFDALVTRIGVNTLDIALEYRTYKECLEREIALLDIFRHSKYVPLIEEANQVRKEILFNMTGSVRRTLVHFQPRVRASGSLVFDILKFYKNFAPRSFVGANAMFTCLIRELCDPVNQRLVQRTGLTPWILALEVANNRVIQVMRERDAEIPDKPKRSIEEVRVDVDRVIEVMIDRVETTLLIFGETGNSALVEFVNACNELFDKYRPILSRKSWPTLEDDCLVQPAWPI
jgi:hypothetical protein